MAIKLFFGQAILIIFQKNNLLVDLSLILFTALAIVSKRRALKAVVGLLKVLRAPQELLEIASREKPLTPQPPPGSTQVVTSRQFDELN